ncbi:MAG: ABC-type glycerol-3-phosphate transport system permease component [Candidatus Latescibacterota bacterium]|jgi:ABC-type glycerol-3-phosphate transport system permease component
MGRLGPACILFGELAIATLLLFAAIYGSLEREIPSLLLALASLAVLSIVLAWKLSAQKFYQLWIQVALIEGCALFAFPFIWLVSTSMKYDEEIFVYPPRWVPALPATVSSSPYATDESIIEAERPASFSLARWQDVVGKGGTALWNVGQEQLGQKEREHDTLRATLTKALFSAAARGVMPKTWEKGDQAIVAALVQRVDAAMVKDALALVYRGVALRAPTIKDRAQNIYSLGAAEEDWHIAKGSGALGAADASGARELTYAFAEEDALIIAGDFSIPVEEEAFLGFTLPMRQDRSWHAWRVVLEIAGQRYTSEDALYWGKHRWQEISFKLDTEDPRDERELGIWPLYSSDDQRDVYDHPGRMRVRLEVERASILTATWRKYAASYYNAYISTEHRWNYVFNSIYLAVLTILGQVLSCSLAAYAFARLRWPGRDLIFGLLLATMMLPGQVTMIPVFMIFRALGWYNTLEALWVPSFFGSAFFIFMLRQFMKAIPGDLEDAAKIDGCGFFGIYWRIILPLTRPALAAVCIFTFMNTWNDFMGPLIYINDQRLYPLALGLFDFRSEHGSEFGMLMAASTLMTLPVIAIFFAAQRYFIQGVTLTGMKG